MAMIKVKRGTRTEINTAASASGLNQGELYLITDEDVLAVGTSTSTYEDINSAGLTDLTTDVTGTLPVANGGTGVTSLSSLNAADLGSSTATDGYVLTADGSGGAAWEVVSGGSYGDSDVLDLFNSTGSAPVYACRAWVNFNGTGTVAIRDSGNVSSITDNGNGDFTVNFTTAMPDANYSATASINGNGSLNSSWMSYAMFSSGHSSTVNPTTSGFRFCTFHPGNLVSQDCTYNNVSVFR